MSAGRRPGPRRRLTDADLVALAVLTDGPAHGHGIWTRLASCEVEDWASVSRAQVYYSIGKLADQDLIRPVRGAKSSGARRERHTWRITAAGRRALTVALSSSHWAGERVVPPFLTWVGLAELTRPATRSKMLAKRKEFLESELERERATLAELKRLPVDARGAKVARSMVVHVTRQMELELDWLRELRRVLAG